MRNIMHSRKYLASASVALIALTSAAAAQEACSSYTIKDGDSLGSIAQSAYGSFDYQMIFNANRNLIDNPNSLETGVVLQIPCEDGQLSAESDVTEIIAQEEEKQSKKAKSNIYEPPIKLLSGNGWEPYTGENMKGGGMLVRLATTALNRGGNDREFNLSFVDDWQAHFDTLLPLGAFDVSVAWYKPADCSNLDSLDDNTKYRCTQLDWSLPIYESVSAYWTMPDNQYAEVKAYSDYAGARVCRPDGWSLAELSSEGLVEPVITLVQPAGPEECIEKLVKGEVDMALLDLEGGDAAIKKVPEAVGVVQPNSSLSKLQTIHFVSHKTNPRGRVYLALMNKGLNEMRESGEWYAVIADSLADFNKLN
ncbi:transporter substrate-binding domain-containing protein [Defluviimonas sp. WL0050]|uniref:Transporter substrate-binding domain-containing protein n=1 Tax=Albidovulum litorale TaxID=2984134 RepID=A0ABT2ZTQ4_9RHOB|nr:transporter substrate-binding domain-containing protein [Defluviimonas sp. WL0050]MCV2874345.1 transporter substrate-binding domain-containing protein [Defluviimonas sp. WL0050]